MPFSTQTLIKPMEVETTHKGPSQRGKKCLRALWSFKNLKKSKKLKKFFRSLTSLSFWINAFCLGFVVWQTIKCMTKYIEKPKGTEISMELSSDLPSFPAVTVCGSFGKDELGFDRGFNFTYLQDVCGIRSAWSFGPLSNGQWANSNCPDPKELFEAIVFKPKEVIKSIRFEYWTKSSSNWIDNITEFYEDSPFGRCFSLDIDEHIQYGIKKINLKVLVNSTIHIHTPGMAKKGNRHLRSRINVELGKWYDYDVQHEYHELLHYGRDPCNNDKTYQIDACNYNATEKQSLEEHGCKTPFGPNKTRICTNQTIGLKAMSTYFTFMYSGSEKNYEGCFYPCSYFIVSTKLGHTHLLTSLGYSHLELKFEQLIKVTKSQYTYTKLSLLAEIGGYVGLFLGISVNQIPYLLGVMKKILTRIRSLF